MQVSQCLALAALAGASLALAPVAGDTPSRTYRDQVHKFSLKIFPDWEQVPVEVGDRYTVAKFYEPGSRGDPFAPEIEVLRLDKKLKGPDGPITGVDPKDREKLQEMLEAANQPESIFDLAFGMLIRPEAVPEPDPKKFKKVTCADKVDGKLWDYEIPRGLNHKGELDWKDKSSTLMALVFAFEKDGVEYGVRLTSAARRRKDFEPAMKTMAKSFTFFDDKAADVESLDVLAGVNITPKKRGEIEKGLIKGWGVEVSPKKNYVVIYNTKNNKNKTLAKIIAERIERIREQVYEVQFPPSEPVTAVSIVRVCGDAKEYHAYGGPGGSAGYWSSGTEELVFYDASPARNIDDDTLAVLYHEAFHQYIYYSVGSVAPHSWFNEGHGDYYAGAEYKGGKFNIKPFDWRIGTVKSAIREGPREFTVEKDEDTGVERKRFANKGYTPLEDLVKFSQGEYYSYPGVSYAQGWSLIYFLREEVPKKRAYQEKWGHILSTYFDVLKREVAKEGKLQRGGAGPDEPDPGDPTDPADPSDPADPADPTDPADPSDPGDPGDGGGEGGDEPPPDPGFQPFQFGEGSESALQTAVREAFKGVDFAELEKAWAEATKKLSG